MDELEHSHYKDIGKGNLPTGFPFEKAVDFFGDGSLLILDAPGHMPGHQMALARTGEDEWIAMETAAIIGTFSRIQREK